jgi:hypothetical protein
VPSEAILRRVAAVTDAELAGEVLAAVGGVLAAFAVWRADPGWRHDVVGQHLQRLTEAAWAAAAALPDRADLDAAVDVARPLLGVWWPSWPRPHALATAAAVERLRVAALHRPVIIRQVRGMVAGLDDGNC